MQKTIGFELGADGHVDDDQIEELRQAFAAFQAAIEKAGLQPRGSWALGALRWPVVMDHLTLH